MDFLKAQVLAKRTMFLKETQKRADSLLPYIDKRAKPEVFLLELNIPETGTINVQTIAAKDSWAFSLDFSDITAYYAKSFSLKDAVLELIKKSPALPKNLKVFVSNPSKADANIAFVCLAFDDTLLSKYPVLETSALKSEVDLSPSFMVSLILEFIEKHRVELNLPLENVDYANFHFGLDVILQQAGRNFVSEVAYRVLKKFQSSWINNLYMICTGISRSGYELAEARGSVILAPEDEASITHSVKFSGNLKLSDIISARKLLELTKDGMALHTDGETIFGLCRVPKKISKSSNNFTINFLGSNKWSINYAGKPLIVIAHGIPRLPRTSFEGAEFAEAIKKVFKIKTERTLDRLVELIQTAAKERKGSLLVISKKAKEESKRLAPQSTTIVPIHLTTHILSSLTPIDGAILISPNGVCYSIGTILDGLVTTSGDAGRGARYNSAIKYVESRKALKEACMAICISEDGNIDIII